MCDIDLEECTVWRETPRKARKPHHCACCRRRIRPGKGYTEHFSVHDGSALTERLCATCSDVKDDFEDAHGQSPIPSELLRWLAECVVSDDRTSEWRKPLAGILWRRREAGREDAHA